MFVTAGVLLASGRQRQDLTDIPHYTWQPHATKNCPAPNANRAKFEDPALRCGDLRGVELLTWGLASP